MSPKIAAIVIGRGGSKGFPGKNSTMVLDKPLMAYPISAAKKSKYVEKVFFSTDSSELAYIADEWGAEVIIRPDELATDAALGSDVFAHAANEIFGKKHFLCAVLMFANAPCITSQMIDTMIGNLYNNKKADSICTVSKYNMYSPCRARVIGKDGAVINYINNTLSDCDRNSSGDFYYYDCSCAVVRPQCLRDMKNMPGPQPWLGRVIIPYEQQIPALDVDYAWQVPQIEYWLRNNNGKE